MNVEQVASLLLDGYDFSQDRVKVTTKGNLSLLSYTAESQWANEWTEIEQLCRGLIIDNQTGEIVARPFRKFFNYGQNYGDLVALPDENAVLEHAFEKMDGSLIIGYKYNGDMNFATCGSFDSEQAIWAKTYFDTYFYADEMADAYTYLFECIYPENRIVCDYGDRKELVLLAIINKNTGIEVPWRNAEYFGAYMGFGLPVVYDISSPEEALEAANKLAGTEAEGFVLKYSNGDRFKIKGCDYLMIHKFISSITKKNAFEMWINKQPLPDVPDEFIAQIDDWFDEFTEAQLMILDSCREVFDSAPKNTKKEFALAVKNDQWSSVLFAMYDGGNERVEAELNKHTKRYVLEE